MDFFTNTNRLIYYLYNFLVSAHLRIDYEFESHDLPTRKREFLTEESRHRFFENIINKDCYSTLACNKVIPKDPSSEFDGKYPWKS